MLAIPNFVWSAQQIITASNATVDVRTTVLVIEHNLDVATTAGWIINMGPEGGQGIGWIIARVPVGTVPSGHPV